MTKIPLLVLCLSLIPCLGAADPAPAPAPAPASAPAPDASQIELARQVIKSMHADRMFDQMAAQMERMAVQTMNLNTASLTPEQQAAVKKLSSRVMAVSMEEAKGIMDKMDVIYAEVYSPAELKAMKAFFESPEGASMLQKQPQIMQKLMPYVTGMQRELIPKIQKIVADVRAEEQKAAPAPTVQAAKP